MNEMAEKLADKAKDGLCYAEFPTYDGEFYVPEGFIDISFAKDIVPCPSIMDAEAVLVLRQDFANPDLRAMRGKRYRVDICREEIMEAGYESYQPIFSSEDFGAALSFVKEKLPEMKDRIEEYIADERREKILDYQRTNIRNAYDDFYAKAHAIAADMPSEKPVYRHDDDPSVEAMAMMLLEKKYNKNAIYRAFKECSPLTAYPGRETELAKQALTEVERRGAEHYVSKKFLAHLSKRKEAAR